MTTQPAHGPFGHFEELTQSECLDLLAAKKVGRVALCGPTGPLVFPVNYALVKGSVVFRTAPYTQMARALKDSRAAFEVDEIDEYLECGWSVLVVGDATHIDDVEDVLGMNESDRPLPWVSGQRPLYIQIRPVGITGRRVHPS